MLFNKSRRRGKWLRGVIKEIMGTRYRRRRK
jgi:hypothetical protein